MSDKQTINKNHKFKLKWKKRFGDNRSFSWLECYIKELGWTYGIEQHYKSNKYTAWVDIIRFGEPITLLRKPVQTIEEAEDACKTHIISISNKIQDYVKRNRVK